jgi:hypothetical protein
MTDNSSPCRANKTCLLQWNRNLTSSTPLSNLPSVSMWTLKIEYYSHHIPKADRLSLAQINKSTRIIPMCTSMRKHQANVHWRGHQHVLIQKNRDYKVRKIMLRNRRSRNQTCLSKIKAASRLSHCSSRGLKWTALWRCLPLWLQLSLLWMKPRTGQARRMNRTCRFVK